MMRLLLATLLLLQGAAAQATITSLTESTGKLTGFGSTTYNYVFAVPFTTATFAVTATVTSPVGATVSVNGLASTAIVPLGTFAHTQV